MSTHTMSRNADPRRIEFLGKRRKHRLRQFLRHVGVHVVPFIIWRLCGVDVEPRAGTKVP